MAYGAEIARVQMTWQPAGSAAWTGEEAICGFWVNHAHTTGNTFSWDTALQQLADDTVSKLVSHWADLGSHHGGSYEIVQVKAAQIGTDGSEINAKTSVPDTDALKGNGGGVMPPEVAVCISLLGYVPGTFVSHAGRKRGRMYLPYIATSQADTSGKISSQAAFVDHWTAFFNDIQGMHVGTTVPPGGSSDFWGLVIPSKIDAGITQVERIGCDDQFDSQRRRQHQHKPTPLYGTLDHG